MRARDFGPELQRRRVLRAAAFYLVAAWLAIQVAATIFPLLHFPEVAARAVLTVAAIGFLPAMVFAWFFDWRIASGITRTRARGAASGEQSAKASIVVLPFTNLSGDPENEYFSDGIAEEITNALTRIAGLRVVSRTSAYSFRGKQASTREIGEQLNVGFVLEGSVRRAESRIRMTAKLARTADDTVLWADQFDRVLNDVFAVQEEITRTIVATLSQTLQLAPVRPPALIRPARTIEAYDFYLLGRHQWNKRSETGMRKALEFFEQALQLDPDYAPAYSGISDASALLASWNFALPTEMFPRAAEAARRALELDDQLAESHASIGFIKYNWEWDWAGAERELRRAIELNPSLENAHRWLSGFLAGIGRNAEALAIAQRVEALDPLSVLPHMNLGIIHWLGGRNEAAVEEFERVVTMDPKFARAYSFLSAARIFAGQYQEALAAGQKACDLSGNHRMMRFVAAVSVAMARGLEEARPELEAVLPELHGIYAARVHFLLGNEDAMYAALQQGINERGDWMYSLGVQPWFRQLHGQPRFDDLLRQINVTGERALVPAPQ